MQLIINELHDEERALYGLRQASLEHCTFAGPADGESALKETADLEIDNCNFELRYPLWHTKQTVIVNSRMSETCRAALWYDQGIDILNCQLNGIKAMRECTDMRIVSCNINSSEFGWFCQNIELKDCQLQSEYPFLQSAEIAIQGLHMTAKYSFQYVHNVTIHNSVLDTKDAFWHSKNVAVFDSVIKGEYLGWYSENLRLVRCKIIGTQPLCYAQGLVLENCTMQDTDLCFEKSSVQAVITTPVLSIKNPLNGCISVPAVEQVIFDDSEAKCQIIIA